MDTVIKTCQTLEELRSFLGRELNGSMEFSDLSRWEQQDLRNRIAAAAGIDLR